ncbi:hypothetical protein BD626DRAFT_391845 [Schizophyllum amplum]|uniref:DUF3533 domain-containing protein n=1 Tax=Schizophyllum amplum TaxID=97359 RepID=A0A550CWX6_9AGAR|nr:hypothetical protein BD626DRAFT_391845 [Auriculariopsis ampla]
MSDQATANGDAREPAHYSIQFFDSGAAAAVSRQIYMKIVFAGVMMMGIVIFGIFSIYWGALWKVPAHSLSGWVIDFDGDTLGSTVSNALIQSSAGGSKIRWTTRAAIDFPNGNIDVANSVVNEKVWVAVVINNGATSNLNSAIAATDASYNGSSAVTAYGVEARNENAYRSIISPIVEQTMLQLSRQFAQQTAKQLANSDNIANILSNAPQLITQPLSFTLDNLRPFDVPVASAVTFVGLIYLLILSFFVVMIGGGAREASGLERKLTTKSLIYVRMVTSAVAYLILSLFYSLLSRAFQLPFDRKYGSAGFVLFWMISFVGMLCLGLSLEAMITILTIRFMPFFMILWIITNVSVCFMPIEVLPKFYHYGYAMPFYNVSHTVRSIVFGSKNTLGQNFGILVAWCAISCITLPLFQWLVRRKLIAASRPMEIEENAEEKAMR